MIDKYTTPEMSHLWSDSNKYFLWTEIEKILARAMFVSGDIDEKTKNDIVGTDAPSIESIKDHEAKCSHETIAFTKAFGDQMDPSSAKWIHYGLTSSDVIDTAQAIMIKNGLELICDECGDMIDALTNKIRNYRELPCIGRTHGQIAEPTTYGLRFYVWRQEVLEAWRDLENLCSYPHVAKVSGAVGTGVHISKFRNHIIEELGRTFGVYQDPCQTQIVSRHRYSKIVFNLAQLMSAFEKICLNIRILQSSGIEEISEYFTPSQKGSSAMPHKRNPIACEQICGLARVARSYVAPMMETNATWLERDLTNSSLERVILPDVFNLVHHCARSMKKIVSELEINKQKTADNISSASAKWPSQSMMLAQIRSGIDKAKAYDSNQKDIAILQSNLTDEEIDYARSVTRHIVAASLRIPIYETTDINLDKIP